MQAALKEDWVNQRRARRVQEIIGEVETCKGVSALHTSQAHCV